MLFALAFFGGVLTTMIGHDHPAVTAAAHEQLDRLWHASNLYWTEPMLRLAALLSGLLRCRRCGRKLSVQLGFKGSSQRLPASIVAPRQRLRRAFSSQGSFAVWH